MKEFYKIAGLVVQMDSFGRTSAQAEAYRIPECDKVDIVISSKWNKYKHQYPNLTDSDGEYIATAADFYKQLLSYNGLMLHSSTVVVDGKAYLFSANPGTGKSTHTALWLKLFGDRAFILNDDKPALRLVDGQWYAYGTPWSGKHDLSVNVGVPVAGIAVLERGLTNEIQPYLGKDATFAIYSQTLRPKAMESRIKILDHLDRLMTQVPVWRLKCNMDLDAAITAYEAMSGDRWRQS